MAANYDTLEAGRTGLVNPGNHCYMLSICQALAHTDLLRNYLIDQPIEERINFGRSGGMVTFNFAILVRQMWSNKFTSLRSKNRLKKELGKGNQVFGNEGQQDASELLVYLIETILRDLRHPIVSINPGINNDNIFAMAALKWAEFKTEYESPIANIFHHMTVTTSICKTRRCRPKWRFEAHCYQHIPIAGNSLQASLAQLYGSTQPSDVPKTCDFCNKKDIVREDIKFWGCPKVLIFCLGRQKATYDPSSGAYIYAKLTNFIDYPHQNLDMRAYFHAENPTPNAFYDLYAVVNHMGKSLDAGHYIALAKRSHSSAAGWRKFDDNKVKDIPISEVVNENGYILFYRLRGSH